MPGILKNCGHLRTLETESLRVRDCSEVYNLVKGNGSLDKLTVTHERISMRNFPLLVVLVLGTAILIPAQTVLASLAPPQTISTVCKFLPNVTPYPYTEITTDKAVTKDQKGNLIDLTKVIIHYGPGSVNVNGTPVYANDWVEEKWVLDSSIPAAKKPTQPTEYSTLNTGRVREAMDQELKRMKQEEKREPKPDRLTEPVYREPK